LDRHRRDDGSYDCLVPGSGGKDSAYAAHVLKYKYGMHPLTVTFPATVYTDYGYQNFLNWVNVGGFDNVMVRPNGRVHRLLTQLATKNLLHPFQTFILGQKSLPVKVALQYGIPLVFYGENEAEYGNPIADNQSSLRDSAFHTMQNLEDLYIGGVRIPELIGDHGLTLADLQPYLPPDAEQFERGELEVHYLGYYLKWTPQEAYYYASEHTGFQARPYRSAGTYAKYHSIDDKIDDLHFYTTHIKFGLGRASYDAAQEVRNKHLTREEAVALVHRFDGEYPSRYLDELMDYLEMTPEEFDSLCDRFRSPHLWEKSDGQWRLKHQVA
jgi:N-acetyl sugar amidotransferase